MPTRISSHKVLEFDDALFGNTYEETRRTPGKVIYSLLPWPETMSQPTPPYRGQIGIFPFSLLACGHEQR